MDIIRDCLAMFFVLGRPTIIPADELQVSISRGASRVLAALDLDARWHQRQRPGDRRRAFGRGACGDAGGRGGGSTLVGGVFGGGHGDLIDLRF